MKAYTKEQQEAIRHLVEWILGPSAWDIVWDGLPEGSNPEWGYDWEFAEGVARSCSALIERQVQRGLAQEEGIWASYLEFNRIVEV